MELATETRSYLNPTDPRGYHSCSGFGHLQPRLPFRARQLASHKRSNSDQQSSSTESFLNSDRQVRYKPSRLSKTLPEVLVKNIPKPHSASKSLPFKGPNKFYKDHYLVGSRPSLRPQRGFRESVNVHVATNTDLSRVSIDGRQWWELPTNEYRIKPTNFEKRRSYLKDSETNFKHDRLHPMEGSLDLDYSLNNHHCSPSGNANTHRSNLLHFADNVKHDGLTRSKDLCQLYSCETAILSKDSEKKFVLGDKKVQCPPSTKGPSLSHAKQSTGRPSSLLQTGWHYSRSRSGIRKSVHNPPAISQVFAVDFNPTGNQNHHVVATNEKTHSNVVNVPTFHKSVLQPQAIKPMKESLRYKNQYAKVHVPKVSIDGTVLDETPPLTGAIVRGEQLFQKEIQLLALTCEWIKMFESSQNSVSRPVQSSTAYLSVIDLSRFFEQSKDRTESNKCTKDANSSSLASSSNNHNLSTVQNILGSFKPNNNVHSYSKGDESHLNDSQLTTQVNLRTQFPGVPTSRIPPLIKEPSYCSLFMAKQTEPNEKPPNPFPDLVIFGHHLQSLCDSRLLAGQEEERKKLKEVAQSALNGQLKKEHVVALHTIYEQLHSKLSTPLPPSSVSYDMASESQDCVKGASEHVTSDVANESQDCMRGASSDYVTFDLDSAYVTSNVANENEDDDSVQQFSSGEKQDHETTAIDPSRDSEKAEPEDSVQLNVPAPKTLPKLDIHKQQARSNAENNILLSVREDLKYFKESMSMSLPSKNKPRESLLPPLKMNTVVEEKSRRSKISFANTKQAKKNHSADENGKSTVSVNPTPVSSHTNLDMPNSVDSESVTSDIAVSRDRDVAADKLTVNTRITLTTSSSPQPANAAPAKRSFSNTKASFDSKRTHSLLPPRPSQEPRHKRLITSSTSRSSVQVGQAAFPEVGQLSRRGSSLSRSGVRSRTLLSSGRLPTPDRPQFAVNLMNEIGDIKSLVQAITGTANPLSISRPHTAKGFDTDHEQRSNLSTREKGSRGGSRQLATLVEQEQDESEDSGEEKEENEEDKIERLKRIEEELEQSLNNEEKIRRERKKLAEARSRAECYERERQRLLQENQAQEMRKLATERERHAAVLDKLKLEADIRQCIPMCIEPILKVYNNVTDTWNDVDYSYIFHYLGQECCQKLRREEDEMALRQKQEMEKLILEACDFQRRELFRKLEEAQRAFMNGLEVERDELNHLLNISRAFVYSYFENVSDQVYHVPEELLN